MSGDGYLRNNFNKCENKICKIVHPASKGITVNILFDFLVNNYSWFPQYQISKLHDEVYSIQQYVIKFVSDLQQVGGFLRVLRFPLPFKPTATI